MFLDAAEFPFTATLEANWEAVRDELRALSKDAFMAWPEKYLYGSGWEVFGLYAFGRKMNRNCHQCPETTHLVETIPGLATAGFSWLDPGAHIRPHMGYVDTVLRCHLGLVVPEKCELRVGDEVRAWEEGKCLVFDDRTEHEAWNRSETVRVVLLIDFIKGGAVFTAPDFVTSRIPDA